MVIKQDLRTKIKAFGWKKYLVAIPLFILGILGLVLPVIPGLALLFLASMLLFPRFTEKAMSRFGLQRFFHK
jgi:uncharacterized protein YqgC (DUF456 family)